MDYLVDIVLAAFLAIFAVILVGGVIWILYPKKSPSRKNYDDENDL